MGGISWLRRKCSFLNTDYINFQALLEMHRGERASLPSSLGRPSGIVIRFRLDDNGNHLKLSSFVLKDKNGSNGYHGYMAQRNVDVDFATERVLVMDTTSELVWKLDETTGELVETTHLKLLRTFISKYGTAYDVSRMPYCNPLPQIMVLPGQNTYVGTFWEFGPLAGVYILDASLKTSAEMAREENGDVTEE
jgi:hypothetical protein